MTGQYASMNEEERPTEAKRLFNAVKQFTCVSQGQAVRVQVPFSFNLN